MLKNWCFWTWCWRRLLRVLWAARRSSQSILKEINPDYSSEGPMLRLELQYFGHLMWEADSLEKTMMLGKIEGRRRRDDRGQDSWMASLTQWTWVWVNSGKYRRTGNPGMLQSMRSQVADTPEQLKNNSKVCYGFSSKEQASYHFVTTVTFYIYLKTKKIKSATLSTFPIYLPWSDGILCHYLNFWMLSLGQFFHSPLSALSRGSLVPLHFLP